MPAPSLIGVTPQDTQGNSISPSYTSMGVADGDVLVMAIRSQGTVTADITPPTGWFRAGTTGSVPASDRFLGIFYKPLPTVSGETLSYTFTGISGGGNSRVMGYKAILRGADLAHLNDGGLKFQASATIASVSAVATPYSVIGFWGAEFTAGNSSVPASIPTDFTLEGAVQTAGSPTGIVDNSVTTGSRTGAVLISKKMDTGTLTVPSLTVTYTGTPTDAKSASWIVRGLTTAIPIGSAVKLGNGTAARLSYLDGTGTRKAPTSVSLWLPGFSNVTAFLAKQGVTMVHRGGSLNFPEFSQVAYDKSVRLGFGMLEFSCGWTSDNVPFGLGDQYLDTAAGVTGSIDPTTMNWATLSGNYLNKLRPVIPGVYQPFYLLVDFLDKYTPTHVVAVDPKFGAGDPTKINAMLNICDTHGGPSKIIIKFDSPITDSQLVVAAKARGYTTMNYWGTEVAKLTPTYHTDKWDLIGVRYDADQTMYNTASSFGKLVWAAVIPDQAGVTTAASRGANLMMISNPVNIAPVSVR